MMKETTSTTNQGDTISAEEMIKRINETVKALGPLPEIRQSRLVAQGADCQDPG